MGVIAELDAKALLLTGLGILHRSKQVRSHANPHFVLLFFFPFALYFTICVCCFPFLVVLLSIVCLANREFHFFQQTGFWFFTYLFDEVRCDDDKFMARKR